MDTVVSARPGKAAILVLTERLTRNEITAKLPDKSAASVVQALDDLEKEWGELFPRVFQTITVDNGSVCGLSRHRAQHTGGGIPDEVLLLPPVQLIRARK